MKERPILFSAPMVKAILYSKKSQTRRAIKTDKHSMDDDTVSRGGYYINLSQDKGFWWTPHAGSGSQPCPKEVYQQYCPYGVIGDRLWVRETFYYNGEGEDRYQNVAYRADGEIPDGVVAKWRPSIYMPRWASRLTLEITDVDAQRLCDISEGDAKAEGVVPESPGTQITEFSNKVTSTPYRHGFYRLWDSINAKRGYPWYTNPWVWKISFKVV